MLLEHQQCFLTSTVACMQSIDIVVAGDSMMRQHFTRLVQLLRGRQRNIDYRVHTHGSYSYCDEVTCVKMQASAQQCFVERLFST